jgi:hypothetical protein
MYSQWVIFRNWRYEEVARVQTEYFRNRLRGINEGNAMVPIAQLSPTWQRANGALMVMEYAPIGNPSEVRGTVTVVRSSWWRTFEAVEAIVRSQDVYLGVPIFNLRSTNRPIIPGDSGGGVWFRGRLVGNNWWTDKVWNDATGKYDYLDTFVAAQYP